MAIKRPYYNLHQIITGKYTSGNEYVLDDGTDYVGMYHILPNSQLFTGSIPMINSRELFDKRHDLSESVLKYNRIKNIKDSRYIAPISYQPNPSMEDYEFGEIERYFVQKRNNPRFTIIEIDSQQYNSINRDNSVGINGVIWNSLLIPWKISLLKTEDIVILNRREILRAEESFFGISGYLTNALEFYR